MTDDAETPEQPYEDHDSGSAKTREDARKWVDGEGSSGDGAVLPEDVAQGEPVEEEAGDAAPDVYLDVPILNVDEIDLDVDDLRARVSLQAEVLDLLKLNVGADVALGHVHLGIKGVEAQAQLTVRLDNVAKIIQRVLTTVDRNPQILEELTRGAGTAIREVGAGAKHAVGELGEGTGSAVRDVGRGAGSAVEDVGRGAGSAVEDVGEGVGSMVEDVGEVVGEATEDVVPTAGGAVASAGREAGDVVRGARHAETETGKGTGGAVREAGRVVAPADRSARQATNREEGVSGERPLRRPARSRTAHDRESSDGGGKRPGHPRRTATHGTGQRDHRS